jgi:tetratricopeptide (TPR) repeat protein/transcriptional regulator with XRE-family HTH domain
MRVVVRVYGPEHTTGVLMEFGEQLKALRLDARPRLSQLALGERVGVSDRTIRSWEKGETTPREGQARDLAEVFGLTGLVYARFVALAKGISTAEALAAVPSATRTLPADIASFTGRQRELEALAKAAAAAPRDGGVPLVCVIHGMPGIGKTKLAVNFAHKIAADCPDGQFFVELYGHSAARNPVNPEGQLGALLLKAGVPRPLIPDGVAERAAAWRHWTADRKVLVLLDDARDADQVIPLLPGSAGNIVLITTRHRLAGLADATDIPVKVMAPEDSARLFVKLAGRPGLDPRSSELASVVGVFGGLPLIIAPMASQLRQHEKWRVSDLVGRLGRSGGRLGLRVSERATVRDALDLSYRNFGPELQRMFRRLALHPGPDIDPDSAAALDGRDSASAGALLDELFRHHLIDELAPERYQYHELVRDYARDRVTEDLPADQAAAEHRLLDYYLTMARRSDRQLFRRTPTGIPEEATEATGITREIGNRDDAFAWLDDNYRRLQTAADYAYAHGYLKFAALIPAYLDEYLIRRGHWNDARHLHEQAVRAAGDADRPGRARALGDLGAIQYMRGDLPAARDSLGQALSLFDALGDRLGQAQVLRRVGAISFAVGDYQDAGDKWLAALGLYREVSDRRGEADTLCRLGILQYETGQITAALASQSAARDMAAELDDPVGLANALCYLGEVQRERGNYREAIKETTSARDIYGDLGDDWNVAGARYYLGAALRTAGIHAQASRELDLALKAYRTAGDKYDEAGVLNQIGLLQTATRDYESAAASLGNALELYQRYGSENGIAEVLNGLGELTRATADTTAAEKYHRQALAIAERKNILREEARAREGIGHALLSSGRAAEAADYIRAAREMYEKLGSPSAARLAELPANHPSTV